MAMSSSVRRVLAAIAERVDEDRLVMLESTGKSSQEAADQLGVGVAQIAKSIVFTQGEEQRSGVVVVISGALRVDADKVAEVVGPVTAARADAVKAVTGFSIGGVSPIGLPPSARILVDRSLLEFDRIWPAAGHPHAVFSLTPDELVSWTGAEVGSFAE